MGRPAYILLIPLIKVATSNNIYKRLETTGKSSRMGESITDTDFSSDTTTVLSTLLGIHFLYL